MMLPLAAWVDLFRTGIRLSGSARAFLCSEYRRTAGSARGDGWRLLRDDALRRGVLRSLLSADRGLREFVPAGLCRRLGREPTLTYGRLMAFAWLNVEFRCRMLDAFDLPYDNDALHRMVLVSILIREWNDALDHTPAAAVLAVLNGEHAAPPDACRLVAHLVQERRRLLPPDLYPRFTALWPAMRAVHGEAFAPARARARLQEAAHLDTLAALYCAGEEIPPAVLLALAPVSFWFYALDQYADAPNDRALGRPTFLRLQDDPEDELRRALHRAEESLVESAPRPGRLLGMMRHMTAAVLGARRDGIDLEQRFLYGDRFGTEPQKEALPPAPKPS
jgi:hypothetical protein